MEKPASLIAPLQELLKRVKKERARCHWAVGTVWDYLHCETYVGRWHYGKQSKPLDECVLVSVPRIVDDATFAMAHEMGKRNALAAMRNVKEGRYLMRYRLTCQCGHRVAGTASIKSGSAGRSWGSDGGERRTGVQRVVHVDG